MEEVVKVGSRYRLKANWKDRCVITSIEGYDPQNDTCMVFYLIDGRETRLRLENFVFAFEPDDGRPPWDVYFMQLAMLVSTRGTCDRKQVGAVLVKDRRILATGYNGSEPGAPHCSEVGHDLVETAGKQNCQRTLHSEQNIFAQAAKYGIQVEGATLYVNTFPCWNICAKLILATGIKRVLYMSDYNNDERVKAAFKRADIQLDQFDAKLL